MATSGQSVSELFARVAAGGGIKAAVDAHKNDELKLGFVDLPAFSNAVAKLTKFEFYNDEGVLKLRAVAVIDVPMYAEGGVPLKGKETTQFRQLTEVNRENDVKQITDLMRQLIGQERFDKLIAACANANSGYDLVRAAESIQAATLKDPIYFECSNKFEENKSGKTDKNGKPYPGRCWQRWYYAIPGYTPMNAAAANVKTVTPSLSNNGNHTATPAATKPTPVVAPTDPVPWTERAKSVNVSGTVTTSSDDTFSLNSGDDPDWDMIAAQADAQDSESSKMLFAAAIELGYTEEDCEFAPSNSEIARWVKLGVKKGEQPVRETEQTETKNAGPKVGSVAKFYPIDPKDESKTRRLKRGVMCEVFSVDSDNEEMTLRSLADANRSWSGVSWDDPNVEFPKAK